MDQTFASGERVRVTHQAPEYSAFDGWTGVVVGQSYDTVGVTLDRNGITLPFAPSELRSLAIPTARVGAHFPEYGQVQRWQVQR